MKKINNKLDQSYLSFAADILENGKISGDRTGTGTKKVFGRMLHHNMSEGFPLLTSKSVHLKSVITELLWFISGVTNIKPLVDQNNYIWVGDCYKHYCQYLDASTRSEDQSYMVFEKISEDRYQAEQYRKMTREEFIDMIKSAPKNYQDYTEKDTYSSLEAWKSDFVLMFGELGPVYGAMWNNFNGVNQLEKAIHTLQTNPNSRRILVSAWNPAEVDKVVLPPCHYGFQLVTEELTLDERVQYTRDHIELYLDHQWEFATEENLNNLNVPKYRLNLMYNQRSCDFSLGVPFNISSYGLLLMMFAQQVNMIPNQLIASMGDVHIYLNQEEGIKQQMNSETYPLPTMIINKAKSLFDYKYEDFTLLNYQNAGKIAMPLSN